MSNPRKATLERTSKETSVTLALNLDGSGRYEIHIGLPFLEHMLELLAFHASFDLEVKAASAPDSHHLAEDVGICLGKALDQALGDKKGIVRYGWVCLPMDETLMLCSLDVSGRPFLAFEVDFPEGKIGDFDTELFEEFFRAFATNAQTTLHFRKLSGSNSHHVAEACFKSLAKSLKMALQCSLADEVPSTKGLL
jgi:imidazoleglycerol-phosphate dehydratase